MAFSNSNCLIRSLLVQCDGADPVPGFRKVHDFEAAVAHLDHAVERAAEQEAALLEASMQKAERAAAESAEAEAKSLLFKAASSPLIKEAEALVEHEVPRAGAAPQFARPCFSRMRAVPGY